MCFCEVDYSTITRRIGSAVHVRMGTVFLVVYVRWEYSTLFVDVGLHRNHYHVLRVPICVVGRMGASYGLSEFDQSESFSASAELKKKTKRNMCCCQRTPKYWHQNFGFASSVKDDVLRFPQNDECVVRESPRMYLLRILLETRIRILTVHDECAPFRHAVSTSHDGRLAQ